MIALIVGNGEVESHLKAILPKKPFVICADGGVRHMKTLGLKADIIMGDMDSVAGDISVENTIVYPVRKDFTDSELAVYYALDNGYTKLYMLGFTGTRLDHTLSNLFLLNEIQKRGARGVIIDGHNSIWLADKENEISGKKGDIISIIPIEDTSGITTEGLEYPLTDETLFFGKSRGVSNVMESDICWITIKSGRALIIKSRD